ncbi:MAG: hypothetical protein Q8S73_03215 [Deltaproteobacteria bacterium]|nr:hypothetical protein [Myxococcales bacterium]MDP3213090.1 hypothetical protein [Deltaproteobacteria bacterium]
MTIALFAVGVFAFLLPSRRAGVEAFDPYDGSLREHLGLCGEGAQLIDCSDARRSRLPDRDPSPEPHTLRVPLASAPAMPANPN